MRCMFDAITSACVRACVRELNLQSLSLTSMLVEPEQWVGRLDSMEICRRGQSMF